MNRRTLIKNLGGTTLAMVALPSWANGWTKESLPKVIFFDSKEQAITSLLVETIIPKTDTPGAAELGVDKFLEVMLKDCHGEEDQVVFKKGLKEMEEVAKETFDKSFENCTQAQREHLVNGLAVYDNADIKRFHGLLKYLTVRGYKHTEHYHTITKFEFAPARYFGCVDLEIK